LRELRARYRGRGVPLPFDSNLEHIHWLEKIANDAGKQADRENRLGRIPIPIYDELERDIDELARKHGAIKWRGAIQSLALFGRATPAVSVGLPSINLAASRGLSGVKLAEPDKAELFIPPDFDADNPVSRKTLKMMRQAFDKPPKPKPYKDGQPGLDYRPLVEYIDTHPGVDLHWVASEIGVGYQSLLNRLTIERG